MQPYYQARGLRPAELAGRPVAPLVTQIADGENGGVMMNEFPPKYFEVIRECSGSPTPAVNVTEYLEMLAGLGIKDGDLPALQPVLQHRVWERFEPGEGPARLAAVIGELSAEDSQFTMQGGSWTSNISWVRGYENVLAPMQRASTLFSQHLLAPSVPTSDPRYRRALFHLLACQTSCYRYWGQGTWTDYGTELAHRAARVEVDIAVDHQQPQPVDSVQHGAQRRQFPREERTRPVSHHLRHGRGPFRQQHRERRIGSHHHRRTSTTGAQIVNIGGCEHTARGTVELHLSRMPCVGSTGGCDDRA
jgi:hypothetical protein